VLNVEASNVPHQDDPSMDARYCGNCGTERLSRSHKYCNSCGRQFAGEADNRIRGISRPNLSRQSRKQIVIVSVASVLGAGVLYWLLQELRPKYNSATQQATSFTKGSDQDGVEATPIPSKTSGYHENSQIFSRISTTILYSGHGQRWRRPICAKNSPRILGA